MTSKKDYYETLGVHRNATDAEIKKAFRSLAMKYHPDRTGGDKASEEKFKEVKEAYDVLSDKQKKAAYDQFGHAGVDPSGFGGGAGAGFGRGFNFDDLFGDIGDIFGDVFGGGRRGRSAHGTPGADLQYDILLTLEEAVQGVSKTLEFSTLVSCPECHGTGAKKGSAPITCPDCHGSGQIRMQQGFFSIQQACPNCRGRGQIVKDYCPKCRGQGRINQPKTLSVKIPAGVDNGDRVRLSGEGEAGLQGGHHGDLYVNIQIKPHSIFSRKGNDLYCEVPISFAAAAMGSSIEVPTLEGKVKLKIPEGTQTGKVFRLRGKGVKSVRSHSVGDILCQIAIETPVNLSKKQKTLLEELDQSLQTDGVVHSPKKHSWMENIKKFFDTFKT